MSWDENNDDGDEWNDGPGSNDTPTDTGSQSSGNDWGDDDWRDDDEWDDPDLDNGNTLDLAETLTDGFKDAASVSGVQLGAFAAVIVFVNGIVANSAAVAMVNWFLDTYRNEITDPEVLRSFEQIPETIPLAFDLPLVAFPILFILLGLVFEALKIVAVRVFAAGELDGIPGALAQRRLGVATLLGFVGGFLISVAMWFGFVLLFIPGLIVFFGTVFFRQEIAVRDKGIIAAVKGSWGLFKREWLSVTLLFVALVIILAVAGLAVGFAGGIVSFVLPGIAGAIVEQLFNALIGAATAIIAIAVMTNAWSQLVADESKGR